MKKIILILLLAIQFANAQKGTAVSNLPKTTTATTSSVLVIDRSDGTRTEGITVGNFLNSLGLTTFSGTTGRYIKFITATTIGNGLAQDSSGIFTLGSTNLLTRRIQFVDGNQASGKIIQSDANGNFSWVTNTGAISGLTNGYILEASGASTITNGKLLHKGHNIALTSGYYLSGSDSNQVRMYFGDATTPKHWEVTTDGGVGYTGNFYADTSTAQMGALGNNVYVTEANINFQTQAGSGFSRVTADTSRKITIEGDSLIYKLSGSIAGARLKSTLAIQDGTQGNGKVFTSNASGKGSWATNTGGISGLTDKTITMANGTTGVQNSNLVQSGLGSVELTAPYSFTTRSIILGTSSSGTGTISFKNSTNNNSVGLQSGITSASYTLTLPTTQSSGTQYLQNNGSGVLSWSTSVGATGATGSTGAQGVTGSTGSTGATGSAGTNGTNGSTGPTGSAGSNGTNGTNGATGPTGAAGSNGSAGATGATGAAGTLSGLTTNTILKATSSTTAGNSSLTDDGTTIGLIARSKVGTLISDNFARSSLGGNYSSTLPNVTLTFPSSAKLHATGGAGAYADYIKYTARQFDYELWNFSCTFVAQSISSTPNGFALAMESIYGTNSLRGVLNINAGNLTVSFVNGSGSSMASTPTLITAAVGDTILYSLTREKHIINVYVANKAKGTNGRYRFTYGTSTSNALPNIANARIFFIGGTQDFTNLSLTSPEVIGKKVLVIGTSISVGYGTTVFENRYPSVLFSNDNNQFNVDAGAGEAIGDVNSKMSTEILPLAPTYAILEMGANDVGGSVSSFTTAVQTSITSLVGAGITPIIISIPPQSATDVRPFNTGLSNLASSNSLTYIDITTVMTGGSGYQPVSPYLGDGIHPTDAGHAYMAAKIAQTCPYLFTGENNVRFDNIPAIALPDRLHYVYGTDLNGNLTKEITNGIPWSTIGNYGTIDNTNFIGTMDNVPLSFKSNNTDCGRIDINLYNNFWGWSAGNPSASGNQNNALGAAALDIISSGTNNTAIGSVALNTVTTGSNNTALGYNAQTFSASASNSTAIGANASVIASNMIVLGANTVTRCGINGSLEPYYSSAYQPGSAGQILVSQGSGTAPNWKGSMNAVTGGMYIATSTNTMGTLVAGATGTFPMFQGAGVAPVVSTLVLPNSLTQYDLLYGTTTNNVGSSDNLRFDATHLGVGASNTLTKTVDVTGTLEVIPQPYGTLGTGGTITTSGSYTIHTFTTTATFTPGSVLNVNYLVVAGGGGGGSSVLGNVAAGGGGAGGYQAGSMTLSATSYTATIGAGGAGQVNTKGANGGNSTFNGVTSTGGGGGGCYVGFTTNPNSGGSGGGAAYDGTAGAGTGGQGNNGGAGQTHNGGCGGGGANAVGANNSAANAGANGGGGTTISSNGMSGTYAGGGGGGAFTASGAGSGGSGGGGAGGNGSAGGSNGTANTGGGGGGAGSNSGSTTTFTGGTGGSGIIIISYLTPSLSSISSIVTDANGRTGIGNISTPTALLHVGAGTATASTAPIKIDAGTKLSTTEAGALENDGTNLFFTFANSGSRRQLDNSGVQYYTHNISTPTTGATVTLTNNQYNIINPAGALVALTVNLPSSPSNNDVVYIKYTQSITTVTYANGTVVDGITSPVGGGMVVLTYDSGTTSWY